MAPESTEVVLARMEGRLSAMDGRLVGVEVGFRELRIEMRGGFADLAFVHREVYDSEKRSAREYVDETRKIAETARTVAMATLSFVVVAVGMMLALIKAVGS